MWPSGWTCVLEDLFFDDMSYEILDSKVREGIQVHTKSDKTQEAF